MYYILVLSLTPPGWEPNLKRDTSIAFAIDPLDTPDLSDNVFDFIRFWFIWFHSICWFLFYLNSVIFFPIISHQGLCRPCLQTFLFIFANKRSSFHNGLLLILNWVLVLYSLYLNFVLFVILY